MKVQEIAISKLKPYENNPRHNEDAVEKVMESIKEFGFKVPIVVDSDLVIVTGHTRLKAAQELGLKKVPIIVADDLTPEQIKAFRIADNKVHEYATWDEDRLYNELLELKVLNFDIETFGFETNDIDISVVDDEEKESIIESHRATADVGVEEDDFDIEENIPKVPTAKLGDIWQLGKHRLMCGDSTDKDTVEKLMNGEKADLIVTDPPYNVAYTGKTEDALTIQNDAMSSKGFNAFLTKAFECMGDVLKEGGAFYIWYASREHVNFETALNSAGLQVRQQLIWVKNSMVLGRQDYQWKHEPCLYGWKDGASHNWYSDRSQTTVLEFDKPNRNSEHPTMKPLALIGYQIGNSSKENDITVDLFGGSGSTLIACEQLNRRCFMMELDPKYMDVIIKRWETLTGEKAVLLNGQTR